MMAVVDTVARAREPTHRRFRVVVIVVSVSVAIAGSLVLALRDTGADTTTRGVAAILRVPSHPGWMAASDDALWLALADAKPPARDRSLLRLDLASGAIDRSILVGGQASYLTRVGDRVVASVTHVGDDGLGPSRLVALDWRTGGLRVRRGFEGHVGALAASGTDLWALQVGPSAALLRLDATTLAPTASPLPLGTERADGLAVGDGSVWVTAADAGDVFRIDTGTRAIARAHVGGAPLGIAVAGGSAWVADRERGAVIRLEPRTLRRIGDPIEVGAAPSWIATAGGYLFVGESAGGTVARIDARTGEASGPAIRVAEPASGSPAFAVAPAGASVWVSSFASNTVTRISSTPVESSAQPVTATSAQETAASAPALPSGGKIVARIPIPAGMGGFTVGEGAVWAMSAFASNLSRIDPRRNAVVARIRVAPGDAVAAGEGAVWISHPATGTISRVDPRRNRVAATIHVGPKPSGIAVSPGAVWVANSGGPSVSRIDPATNRVVATVRVGPRRACCSEHMGVTTGGGTVWVDVPNANRIVRLDPTKNRVTATVKLPYPPCAFLAADRTALWSAAGACGEVVGRIDARSPRLTGTVKDEPHPIGLALGFGSLWVAVLDLKTVDRVDPRTGRVVARLSIAGIPTHVGVGFGSVWVRDDAGRVLRIRPQR
jgi:YVTN family beta-propeller protein